MATRSFGKSSLLIAGGTMTSRVLGLVRAMVLVYAIGAVGFGADAFATAGKVPNTIYTLIATGALTAVLVPQITKAALAADRGASYINKLITLAIVGSGVIMVLAGVVTPPLIQWLGADWSAGELQLATTFAYWLLPQILFFSLYTVLGEILNARSLFGPYAWSPVLNNVLSIAGLITFVAVFGADPNGARGAEAWGPSGIALVAGSASVGVAAQALVLFLFWRRAGLKFRPDFQFRGIGLGTMGKVASWTFLSVLVTQAIGLFNARVMNLSLPTEAGLAAAELAGLIFVLPHSIITISIVTARFTRMSENVHKGDTAAFVSDLTSSARITSFAMVFFTATMLVLTYPLIRLIQPAASYEVVSLVAIVLVANVVGLVPFSLLFVLNRGFFALSDTRTPFFVTLGQSALTLAAAIGCTMIPTSMITAALALAVSALFFLQAITTFLLLRRRIGLLGGRGILRALGAHALAGALAAAGGTGVLFALGGVGPDALAMRGFGGAFIVCAAVTATMGVLYGGVLLGVRNPEAQGLFSRLRGLLPGAR